MAHLGRASLCKVEETPKGWFIEYINRDPLVLERQKKIEEQELAAVSEEERQSKSIQKMIRRDKEREMLSGGPSLAQATALQRDPGAEKIVLSLNKRAAEPQPSSSLSTPEDGTSPSPQAAARASAWA